MQFSTISTPEPVSEAIPLGLFQFANERAMRIRIMVKQECLICESTYSLNWSIADNTFFELANVLIQNRVAREVDKERRYKKYMSRLPADLKLL